MLSQISGFLKKTCLYKPISIVKAGLPNVHLMLLEKIYSMQPVQRNKVLFSSFRGQVYNAQPGMICDALRKKDPDKKLDIVWAVKGDAELPEGVRGVRYGTPEYIRELMTAKVWVDNRRKEYWIRKRKGQFYVQTWHGPICLKAVEKDAEDTLPPHYVFDAKRDSKNADVLVAESAWRKRNMERAFWYDGEICKGEFCDPALSDEAAICEKVRAFYHIDADTKIIVYAPTFRKDGKIDCYTVDAERVIRACEEKFGGKFVFLFRLHPNVANMQDAVKYTDKVLNGTEYRSMEELTVAADMIISDYSGVIFKGYRAGKLVLLFTPDLEQYKREERNLYFDIEKLPSPLAQDNDGLEACIRSLDADAYEAQRKQLVDKIGYYTNDASELIADRIIRVIGGKRS